MNKNETINLLNSKIQNNLEVLQRKFGLSTFETDTLGVLWLNVIEPQLLQKQGLQLSISTLDVCALYQHKPVARLASESPLLLWKMVYEHITPNGSAVLVPCPAILSWLNGEPDVDRNLAGLLYAIEPHIQLSSWPIDDVVGKIQNTIQHQDGCTVMIECDDAQQVQQFAALVGRQLGAAVVTLHGKATQHKTIYDLGLSLQRQAFLDDCIPYIGHDGHEILNMPYALYPILFIHRKVNQSTHIQHTFNSKRKIIPIRLDECNAFERHELWLKSMPAMKAWGKQEQTALCNFPASFGDVLTVSKQNPNNVTEAKQLLRGLSRSDLGPLVKRLDTEFTLDDLILPKTTLNQITDIIFEGQERGSIWSDAALSRLYPYGKGLIALFSGSPGTGKTMAAQVVANTLGLDLLAVDLSSIVSKWVGETSQHLEQLLSSKAAQRSVLFFDEADALYGKRVEDSKDAQDRYANLETSYLMTALENYSGIVILASNLRANIDNAFIRRIRHVIDFPKPNREDRCLIWQRLLTGLFGIDVCNQLNTTIWQLAQIEASAALIKNTVLNVLFICRQHQTEPSARILFEALSKELAKDGTSLSNQEIEHMIHQAVVLQDNAA